MIKLKLDICPQAKQSVEKGKNKKTGKDVFFTPVKKKEYEKDLIKLITLQKPKDFKTMTNPVIVERLRFYMPPTKVMLKSKKIKGQLDLGFQIFHKVKPDIDNMLKPLYDALTKSGLIKDDNLIAWYCDVRKIYRLKPGIEIDLKEIEE